MRVFLVKNNSTDTSMGKGIQINRMQLHKPELALTFLNGWLSTADLVYDPTWGKLRKSNPYNTLTQPVVKHVPQANQT